MPPPLLPTEAREDARAIAQAALTEALAPLSRRLDVLRIRLEELERRTLESAARAAPPTLVSAQPREVAAIARGAPRDHAARAPSVSIDDLEIALDGSRRRRRAIMAFSLFLLAVFVGLFGALAWSYR
jgi:hypothetical protein